MPQRNVFHVSPSADGHWIARMNDDGEPHAFRSRDAALRDARRSATSAQPSDVLIHRADGSIEERLRFDEPAAREGHEATPSKAAVRGHPLHPMVIPFPVAFLIALPAVDVAYAAGAGAFWAEAAFWLLVAGVVTGAVAALIGLVDFVALKTVRQHRVGWWHLFANSGALALAIVNLLVRLGDREGAVLPSGLILSLVTAGLIVAGGWFGGELSYRHRIGVTR